MKKKRISTDKVIKYYSKINIIFNFLTICFIIPYFFYHLSIILYDIFGIVILISWFSNLILSFLIERYLIEDITNNLEIIKKSFRFLIFFSYSILFIIISITISNLIIEGLSFIIGITISYILQIVGFLIISILGIELSYIVIKRMKNKESKQFKKKPLDIYSNRKKCVKLICFIVNTLGIYFAIVLLIPLEFLSPEIAGIIPQFALFLIFIFIINTLIILKLTPKNRAEYGKSIFSFLNIKTLSKRKLFRKSIIVIGFSLSFIFSLPLLSTPYSIMYAENEFKDVYGEDWRDLIPSSASQYFLQSQFNFYNYLMGIPHKDCNIKRNIQYYERNSTKLFFDVFYPKEAGENLPGNNSIIIKIHGGSWRVGDKGIGNVPIISKYLANQGYVVFDIQYGLMIYEGGGIDFTPEYVRGNFTLHDMVYQIGYFTKQLETIYASQFNGNIDSVFIMGGSSGGHLASVIGLGYDDSYFSGNFSTAINLKGIISLYPPNSAYNYFTKHDFVNLIPGDPITNPIAFEKFTPSNLVSLNDPPVLIYQGTQDRLVPPINSEQIEKALEDIGNDCIRLIFPFATHCSDVITNNNFAQVWLYYLERFLYLNR